MVHTATAPGRQAHHKTWLLPNLYHEKLRYPLDTHPVSSKMLSKCSQTGSYAHTTVRGVIHCVCNNFPPRTAVDGQWVNNPWHRHSDYHGFHWHRNLIARDLEQFIVAFRNQPQPVHINYSFSSTLVWLSIWATAEAASLAVAARTKHTSVRPSPPAPSVRPSVRLSPPAPSEKYS